MTKTPTVLFCVGAQKSGTSWLYRYLCSHPECHLRTLKELHYFDTLETPSTSRLEKIRARMDKNRPKHWLRLIGKPTQRSRKYLDAQEWLKLFDGKTPVHQKYLAYLLSGRGEAKLVADITPAYAIVSEDSLREMVNLAPRTKFVFIMRDPLDRLWSSIRMAAGRKSVSPEEFAELAVGMLDRIVEGRAPGEWARSDYASTLKRLSSAVPPDALHIEFYETLFTSEAVSRLTDFLEIEPQSAETEKVVFRGKSLELDPERQTKALALLRPQYDYVTERFGDRVPDRWRSRMEQAS